jgi:hypothetical protein
MPRGKFSSPTLKGEITQEVWDKAVRASSAGCLYGAAIQQRYPHLSGVSVDMATIRVSDKKKGLRYTYLTPDAIQMALLAFDQGWSQPEEREFTVKTAVKTTKIQRRKSRAAERAARLVELEEKETADVLTSDEKRALKALRKNPDRPPSDGKTEAAKDPNNRTIHGRAPRVGKKHPNLLAGRNRQFGKKIAKPAMLFEEAVNKAVEERLKQEMASA